MRSESYKILLIEDNPDDFFLIKEVLEIEGYYFNVNHAETLQEGLKLFDEDHFDIILLDLGLPDSEGFSTFTKTYTHAQDVPIIILTGLHDEEIGVKAVREGAQDYLVKGQVDSYLMSRAIKYAIERKRLFQSIKEREERLKIITDNMQDIVGQIDVRGNFTYISPSIEKILGYEVEDYIGRPFFELDKLKNVILNPKFSLTPYKAEFKVKSKDGPFVWLECIGSPLLDDNNQSVGGIFSARDVTERKKAEIALHESEVKFRTILESSPDSITVTDLNMNIIECNRATIDMYHASSKEEIMGLNASELIEPNDIPKLAKIVGQTLSKMESVTFELNLYKRDGTIFPAELSGNVIVDTSGIPVAFVAITKDITQRKMAEEQIKQSLKEKEMLLKEIHHRVKNNLMIISSLLNLQSQYIKDKASLDIFKESQNRARSMALIHERLYQSTDLKRIDFGDYIRTLTNELFRTFLANPELINLKIDVEDIFLDINTAIPLGLIVNELVTNSFKHAFPKGKSGTIIVDFHSEDEKFILAVCDDGIGFPQSLDFKNTDSLGLQLVNRLTDQIDGEIELNRSKGTEFKVKFKEIKI
ncbi:MAG: aerobic respiration control sensor protein ArcB [Methanobacterium sp. PtaU1.Bin242]|nr:MAG: aerobic respiration control sensor protein ArcB [Methanobacterium sp. PtaU1.Bin242]